MHLTIKRTFKNGANNMKSYVGLTANLVKSEDYKWDAKSTE